MYFSIIITTLNVGKLISITLDSIQKQSCNDYEVLIIDGGSTDDTVLVALQYGNVFSNYSFYSEKDHGIYDAMNKGVEKALGKYIIFLGAGDELYDAHVLEMLKNEIYGEDIIYGYVMKGDEIFKRKIDLWYTIRFKAVCHQGVLARRQVLMEKHFSLKYAICSDQDWIMYMYKKKKTIKYINKPISNWNENGISNSAKGKEMARIEKNRIQRDYYPIRGLFRIIASNIKHLRSKVV